MRKAARAKPKAKKKAAKQDEPPAVEADDPQTQNMISMLNMIKTRAAPQQGRHNYFATGVLPDDDVLVRLLETIPLSAAVSYLQRNQYQNMQVIFEEWRSNGTNQTLPLGEPAFDKITYLVFLWNYRRLPADKVDEAAGVSLLHQVVSSYLSAEPVGMFMNRNSVEAELAADVGVPLDEWNKGLKFSMYGLVNMARTNASLTLDEALAQLRTMGIEIDREIVSYGQRGLSDMAMISLALASVASALTKEQRRFVELFFNVQLDDVTRLNAVVHSLVQRYKLAYLSNYQNLQIGRLPAA